MQIGSSLLAADIRRAKCCLVRKICKQRIKALVIFAANNITLRI